MHTSLQVKVGNLVVTEHMLKGVKVTIEDTGIEYLPGTYPYY